MTFQKCKICNEVYGNREIEAHVKGHFEGEKIKELHEETDTLGKMY